MLYQINELNLKFKKRSDDENKQSFELNIPSLSLPENKIIGIVGESGCGKTTFGKLLIGLINSHQYKNYGISCLNGSIIHNNINILDFDKKCLKKYRNNVQMIFQSPRSALNLNMPLKYIFNEAMPPKLDKEYRMQRLGNRLVQVGLLELSNQKEKNEQYLREYLKKRPVKMSGGQRRRVGIVKVVLRRPEIMIADEPVASLDVSVQGQILKLLKEIHENEIGAKRNHTLIIITHNMRIVRELADVIIVMYNGNVVEYADNVAWIDSNLRHHPYTEQLIHAADYLYHGEKNNQLKKYYSSLEDSGNQNYLSSNDCKYFNHCAYSNKDMDCKNKFDICSFSFDTGENVVACNRP
ncbi:MAG: ABC transporter ATP-binding protein [Bacteroidales bacterium]|nr:ABC transporter ATP-binding protein [Bacteroidales bacterium]